MKVLCVFGTRPEAIKMAPVLQALYRRAEDASTIVCITKQHREMLDQVLGLFGIRPDFDLEIMQPDQPLAQLTARILNLLDPVLTKTRPDWVLVQGDTTTTMASTLAAFYHHVKVAHIEAGLRTWDKLQPFPEEINRKIADSLCDLHFAPTEGARENLLREGIPPAGIVVTGNPVIDALNEIVRLPEDRTGGSIGKLPQGWRLIVVTAHRRENFGAPFENICLALCDIASRCRETRIVFPVHLNPNIRRVAYDLLRDQPNIVLTEPMEYLPFIHLMKRAYLVLTDSGGIQEEAPALGKPVLVLRDTTERPEGVAAGIVRIIGTKRERIVSETTRLLEDSVEYHRMARTVNPYGDGHAAERIVRTLLNYPRLG